MVSNAGAKLGFWRNNARVSQSDIDIMMNLHAKCDPFCYSYMPAIFQKKMYGKYRSTERKNIGDLWDFRTQYRSLIGGFTDPLRSILPVKSFNECFTTFHLRWLETVSSTFQD